MSSARCRTRSPAGPAESPTPGSGPATSAAAPTRSSPSACSSSRRIPDDDVISMGGTLIRLVDQGHEVHVAYQTSGNIAVFDDDAIRFADFVAEFNRRSASARSAERLDRQVEEFVRNKKPGQVDSPMLQQIKGLIRRGEARAAGRGLRRGRRAAPLPGHAVLRDRHGPQEAARRGRRAAHRRAARAKSSRIRSTPPAICPIRTARTASAWPR